VFEINIDNFYNNDHLIGDSQRADVLDIGDARNTPEIVFALKRE
jgi:hypothetical protein